MGIAQEFWQIGGPLIGVAIGFNLAMLGVTRQRRIRRLMIPCGLLILVCSVIWGISPLWLEA